MSRPFPSYLLKHQIIRRYIGIEILSSFRLGAAACYLFFIRAPATLQFFINISFF